MSSTHMWRFSAGGHKLRQLLLMIYKRIIASYKVHDSNHTIQQRFFMIIINSQAVTFLSNLQLHANILEIELSCSHSTLPMATSMH
jgi:hypothetical protein